jgi:hypothetical protein
MAKHAHVSYTLIKYRISFLLRRRSGAGWPGVSFMRSKAPPAAKVAADRN